MKRKGYRSRIHSIKEQRKTYLIVCEGETEQKYFNKFRTRGFGKSASIRLECFSSPRTDPRNIISFARQKIKDLDINHSYGDRVWCVFDIHPHDDDTLKKSLKLAAKQKICLITSNPSFELWFLLHFIRFSTAHLTNSELLRRMRSYIPEYQKGSCYFKELADRKQKAIDTARRLDNYHEQIKNPPHSNSRNPHTYVHQLISTVLQLNYLSNRLKH